jgi:hypothetical protein
LRFISASAVDPLLDDDLGVLALDARSTVIRRCTEKWLKRVDSVEQVLV